MTITNDGISAGWIHRKKFLFVYDRDQESVVSDWDKHAMTSQLHALQKTDFDSDSCEVGVIVVQQLDISILI